MKTLPSEHLRDKSAMRYLTSVDADLDYRNTLAERATAVGDKFLEGDAPVLYSGVPVQPIPLFPENLGAGSDQTVILLCNPKNIHVGIWRQIRVESDRDISEGTLKIVATLRFRREVRGGSRGRQGHQRPAVSEESAMKTLLVRLKPYDHRRGHVLRRYTYAGIKFQVERGWSRVETPVGEYLRTVHQVPGDAYSPLAFDVCTEDEAKAIDATESDASKVKRSATDDLAGRARSLDWLGDHRRASKVHAGHFRQG